MRLGLRMGLNSRQGGGGDLPSLDLAFALDRSFTTDPAAAGNALITSRRGPAAKFSRGSGATQVNAAGLIEYAPENFLVRSEEFDHSGWIKLRSSVADNATTDPAGTLNADKLIEDSSTGTHMTYRTAVLSSLVPHTFSVYAKADGRDFMYLQCGDGFPVNCHAYFDLSAGTKGTVGVNATANIEPAGNGWYRCSVTATPSSLTTNIFYIQPTAVNGSTSYAGDGASGIYLWGAQVERASTARTYYPTTTAAFYGPRFDHDPATGASKGLLIEESRTNLLLRSEAFETTSWLKGGPQPAIITADNVTSPSGTLTADTLTMPAITSGQYSLAAQQFSATSIPYTLTFYVKSAAGGQTIWASLTPDGVNYFRQPIVLTTEWQRVSLTATLTATQWFAQIGIDRRDSSQTGTANFEFHVWGAQLEAGAFPTSYIPTTSGTGIRSADVCSIVGADFSSFYNQSEGTLFADATPQAVDQTTVVIGVNTTASTSSHFIYKANSAISANGKRWAAATVSVAGVQSAIATSTDVAVSRASLSYAYKLNDFAFAYNGTIVGTDNSGTMPTPTAMRIGARDDGLQLNGHIARIQYFRKRLSNAKLQTLTAP